MSKRRGFDRPVVRGGRETDYQRKTSVELEIIFEDSYDPTEAAMVELRAIFSDPSVKHWLMEQGSFPQPMVLPVIEALVIESRKRAIGDF